jgi:hypothetical protein
MRHEEGSAIDEESKRRLRAIIDAFRAPLRHLVEVQGGKLDDIFGYVCWIDEVDNLLTIVSLDRTSDFLDTIKGNFYSEYIERMVPEVIASPAQGKLRTMFHLEDGIYNVAVQLYPGASA